MVCRVRQAVGFLEPAPYREIEQKIRQLETLRTYFLNNSKVCAWGFPGNLPLLLTYHLSYKWVSYRKCYGLSIIHYDMKVGVCALNCL